MDAIADKVKAAINTFRENKKEEDKDKLHAKAVEQV
jgi:hypothetical protein